MSRISMYIEFKSRSDMQFVFRELKDSDSKELGVFFESLAAETRSKFGPHPLTKEHAYLLCSRIGSDNTVRFVVSGENGIIGYFILDFNLFEEDAKRYRTYGIELNHKIDPMFAPCIADEYQNQGIASKVMNYILDYAKDNNLRSIVLMGGTQEPNTLARKFYQKFGFREYGEFYTAHNGLNNIDMMLILKSS